MCGIIRGFLMVRCAKTKSIQQLGPIAMPCLLQSKHYSSSRRYSTTKITNNIKYNNPGLSLNMTVNQTHNHHHLSSFQTHQRFFFNTSCGRNLDKNSSNDNNNDKAATFKRITESIDKRTQVGRQRQQRQLEEQYNSEEEMSESDRRKFLLIALGLTSTIVVFMYLRGDTTYGFSINEVFNEAKPMKQFTLEEVEDHYSDEMGGVWVTYLDGVYDITDFIEQHPGGKDRISMAVGGAVDPFWNIYRQHLTDDVLKILESLRIGTLTPEAYKEKLEMLADMKNDDPYGREPDRNGDLIVHKEKPFNAEVPISHLDRNYITPNELFYVRHHHPVPVIDPKEYKLVIKVKRYGSIKDEEIALSLQDIKDKFKKHTVTSTMQCGGNRRAALDETGENTQGLKWNIGAISTATWSGARIYDVLKYVGITDLDKADEMGITDIHMYPEDDPYDASIPIEKAMDPRGDVLLAYEMNGVEVPREHGYPIRTVVPGSIGARQVKWCIRIEAHNEESYSPWQRGVQYKGFSPNVKKFDMSKDYHTESLSVQEMPVQSAVLYPPRDTKVSKNDGTIPVRGYAWSGGGRGIVRVDVTADNGKSWHTADLKQGSKQHPYRAWAWTFWEADIPIPEEIRERGGDVMIQCKAVDSSYNNQPERIETVWNLRGILNNSWHSIPVKVT